MTTAAAAPPSGPPERPDAVLRLKEADDYRLLFQKGPAPMLVVEPGTMRIRAVNDAATRALGYGQAELVGASLRGLLGAEAIETFAHLSEADEALPILDARSEWDLRRRDGSLLRLHLASAPVRFHGHNCALLYLAPEPLPSIREVGDKNANLTEFSYSALHDLKEPLHLIKGYLTLLRQRGSAMDAESHEYLEYAYTGTQRMQALVLNLLEYLRADVKGLQTEPVAVGAELQAALESLRFQAQEAEATVTWDPMPTVPADRTLLARLLQNLLSNAIKFRGARPVRVHVSAAPRDGEWEFCVKDNGIGIDPKDQARVLQPFQRVHSSDEYPGTGLGLSICRKIVEHHGGRLWIQSVAGEGTEIRFTLPQGA
jgi:PAS domain S-box-containing protein